MRRGTEGRHHSGRRWFDKVREETIGSRIRRYSHPPTFSEEDLYFEWVRDRRGRLQMVMETPIMTWYRKRLGIDEPEKPDGPKRGPSDR